MSGSLEECWLKLRRAEQYRVTFEDEVRTFYKTHPYEIIDNANPDQTRHEFKVIGLSDIPGHWPLLVGDTLYNYRASLDYLVYQLALNVSDPLSPAVEKQCMFPIHGHPDRFRDAGRRRIKMLGAPEQTLVERFQPYDGRYFSPEALSLGFLEDVHIIDKHRRLNLIQQVVQNRTYLEDPDIRWEFSGKPLKEGAIVAIAHCSVSKPEVQMHPNTSIGVSLCEQRILAPIGDQLELVSRAVRRVLLEFATFFR